MASLSKVLIVDDDEEFLALFQKLLAQHVTTSAGVLTANSGPRALGLLESEQIGLMIVDLNLPRMDGLQVISIVRRKHPQTRLVVLTSLHDEQFRARAYALGVDQYWLKPETDLETGMFLEAMEALMRRESQVGFRGVQNKSLGDIIQIECLAQTTSVLKITHGAAEARLWLVRGEVVDAEVQDLKGEDAFQRILSWTEGTFESLPGDEERPRTIFTSVQGLLLNSAQAFDEASEKQTHNPEEAPTGPRPPNLSDLSAYAGVECAIVQDAGSGAHEDHWGIHDPKQIADWAHHSMKDFRALGELLKAGEIRRVLYVGSERKFAVSPVGTRDVCVGFKTDLGLVEVRDVMRTILTKWAS